MMRQEANNTFNDGLIQDLNPINTPNTVLTDSLNATIVTYDGNEFNLQNDRGNYPLQYCKLNPNYIPVGVKEYADTLYIVSYNPIDKLTEIGSYPSPLEISSSSDNSSIGNIQSIIERADKTNNEVDNYYTNLIQKSTMHVFSGDDLKIYPGDEYRIDLKDESKYKYEELEYYIVDENRNKYNITDKIKENNDFTPVGWTVPGWLAAKYRLAVFDDFQVNIRSFIIPKLSNNVSGSLTLNFQLKISDQLLLKNLPDHTDEVGLKIKINNDTWTDEIRNKLPKELLFSDITGKFIEWYDISKVLWANHEFKLEQLNPGDSINITITPFIRTTVDDKQYEIIYNNYIEQLDIAIVKVGSYDDFSIANNVWKFWMEEDDKDHLYLEFDVNGPIITDNVVNLYYKIHQIEDNIDHPTIPQTPVDPDNPSGPTNPGEQGCLMCGSADVDPNTGVCFSCGYHNPQTSRTKSRSRSEYKKITSYGIGNTNMIQLTFDDILKPEGLYIIEFIFSEQDPNQSYDEENSHVVKKLLFTSNIFADFVQNISNFEEITFDQWCVKQDKIIKNKDSWTCNISDVSNTRKPYNSEHHNNNFERFWTSDTISGKYQHTAFLPISSWDAVKETQSEFIRGYEETASIKCSSNMSILNGDLWDGIDRQFKLSFWSHGDKVKDIELNSNNLEKEYDLQDINVRIASKCVVTYHPNGDIIKGSTSVDNKCEYLTKNIQSSILQGRSTKSGTGHAEAWFTHMGKITTEPGLSITKISVDHNEMLPNEVTEKIIKTMKNNKSSLMLIILSSSGKAQPTGVYDSSNECLFWSGDNNIDVKPFLVLLNTSGKPIFFQIGNYNSEKFNVDDSSYEEHMHGIPFDKWSNWTPLTQHIKDLFGGLYSYSIFKLTDGYFINCEIKETTPPMLNVDIKTELSKSNVWLFKNYNLLQKDDRSKLQSYLQHNGISYGNLLTGTTSELDGFLIENITKSQSVNVDLQNEINTLTEHIESVQTAARDQYSTWYNDDVRTSINSQKNISGISLDSTVTNKDLVNKFKQSDFFKLLQVDYDNNLNINANGDKIYFQRVNNTGSTSGTTDICYIGWMNSSLILP